MTLGMRCMATTNLHTWWLWQGIECCKVCGIVRRKDDKNKPCKGPTRIVLRQLDPETYEEITGEEAPRG